MFVTAIGVALSAIFLVSRVSFDANILRLLPQRSPSVHAFQLFLEDFGSLDHLYIVFESADLIGDHRELVDGYVEGLRQAPEIESVDTQLFEPGKDWSYLSDPELHLLGTDGAAAWLGGFGCPRLDAEIGPARCIRSVPRPEIR